jgi:hypothetical protein
MIRKVANEFAAIFAIVRGIATWGDEDKDEVGAVWPRGICELDAYRPIDGWWLAVGCLGQVLSYAASTRVAVRTVFRPDKPRQKCLRKLEWLMPRWVGLRISIEGELSRAR